MREGNHLFQILAQAGWGPEDDRKLRELSSFVASIPASGLRYEFREYSAEAKCHFPTLMSIYWTELLDRIHYASVLSLLRVNAWLSGAFSAIRDDNFHAFSASLRGLIESIADSCHALLWVPPHLSEKRTIISRALGHLADVQSHEEYLDEHLETEMIHFSHAGRHKGKAILDSKKHKARTSKDYLDILKNGPGAILIPIYEQLCEISHPAADSTLPFVLVHEDHESLSAYEIRNDLSVAYLIGFSRRHQGFFRVLLSTGMDTPFSCLKELASFSNYHSPGGQFWIHDDKCA